MILHTGQILYTPSAHKHNRMLLQIVPLTRDVGDNLIAVRKPHLGYLAKRRVRLLRRRRIDARTDTPLLRTAFKRRSFGFSRLSGSPLANKLLNSWHDIGIGSMWWVRA